MEGSTDLANSPIIKSLQAEISQLKKRVECLETELSREHAKLEQLEHEVVHDHEAIERLGSSGRGRVTVGI